MSAAAPWSVKGIDPKAREIAKDLARRSGMTLGEWLNSMIMEDEDEGYATLPRRSFSADAFERRSRSRRLDDAYDAPDDGWQRISASIDAIAARLEAAERRSTVAIQGVDQAVAGLVRRLDSQDIETKTHARRLDDVSEELREGHRRLRAFERDMGPQTQETFGKVEASLGALAGRLYDIEERQRAGVNDLRQRMDAAEKAAGPGVGADLLAQVGARLDQAQGRTTEALKTLERSFAELDRRMRAAEGRIEPEGARDAARFEKLAETLSRQIDGNRAEMMQRLDAAETGARIERVERAVRSIGDQLKASEQKGAQGIEAMGREVLRIARNLNGRMKAVEVDDASRAQAITRAVSVRLDQEFARHAERIDQRLTAADDRNALALEKLGGEITLISDRLSDRIAQSERRSQQALEDIGRRLSESSDKIEQRYDRASGELAERMRMSEERTARLLAEARDSIDARGPAPIRDKPLDSFEPNFVSARLAEPARAVAEWTAPDAIPAEPTTAVDAMAAQTGGVEAAPAERAVQGDWRAAAFPDESFDAEDDWSSVPSPPETTAPFPMAPSSAAPEAVAADREAESQTPSTPPAEPLIQPFGAMGGFGGADVDDALEATASAFVAPRTKPDRSVFEAEDDAFDGDTDFVDPRQLRASMSAGAAAGRSASTRSALDAARAAMAAPAEAEHEAPRQGFGLKPKRGGKSKLQERLDKQAARDGSTVRKTFLASVTAVALTGGVYGYTALTDNRQSPDVNLDDDAAPLAAVARTSMALTPSLQPSGPGAADYDRAVEQLAAGDDAAVETLQRAANLGYAPAQAHLAALYQSGESGLEANLVESRRWARRAAEGGDAKGMHFYAMELFDGVGGPQNRAEALIWLQRAAERGLVDSQYNVARLYENGDDGIARNPTEALKWYTIAARAGDQQAQEALTRLTPAATAAAQRAARAAADAFQAQGAARSSVSAQAMG